MRLMWMCGQWRIGSVTHDGEFIGIYPCDAGDSFTLYALGEHVTRHLTYSLKATLLTALLAALLTALLTPFQAAFLQSFLFKLFSNGHQRVSMLWHL